MQLKQEKEIKNMNVSRWHDCLCRKLSPPPPQNNQKPPGTKINYTKVAGYKVNIQNANCFCFEQMKFEIKNTKAFV